MGKKWDKRNIESKYDRKSSEGVKKWENQVPAETPLDKIQKLDKNGKIPSQCD